MSVQPVKGFDASVSVTTAKRKEQETISENLHSKTFTAWVNHQLQRKGVKIGSVLEDFKDGVSFVQLMEAVFKKKNDKKLNLNPTTEIHRIENVAIAIDMLKVHDPTVQINSKDITDANRKLTLGLIWRLIQSNQMLAPEDTSKSVTQRNKQAKGNLVEFCKKQTEGYEGVQINDLVESFYDGLAFAAIVDKLNPGALNWSEIQKDDPKTRLQKAFDAAEKLLGIPQLLDPEDMVKEDHDLRPDEKCIMTYISEFPLALVERNKNEALKKEKNLADELDRELQKQRELEEQRKREKDQGEDLTKSKENEADKLKNETDLLKAQREEVMAAARARKEDLKTQNEVLAEDNKRLLEEIARIKEETKKLRKDIKSTKNKLIGKLNVVIKEARNLPVMNIGGKSDAYCRIKLETQELKTKIKKKTLNPKWEQEYEFFVTDKSSELDVALWNWDRFSSDDFIGKVVIKISDLKDGTADTKWYNLMSANLEDPAKGEVSLTISFKLGK